MVYDSSTTTMTGRIFSLFLLPLLCLCSVAEESSPAAAQNKGADEALRFEQSLTKLEEAATKGDLYSIHQLCMRYAMRGDAELAASWAKRFEATLQAKADAGDVNAMMQIASSYLHGRDMIAIDPRKAMVYFEKAAIFKNASAAYILAELHHELKDDASSEKYFTLSYKLYSEQVKLSPKDAKSLYWLGFMQQNGIGTKKNVHEGLKQINKAADLGERWALMQLFKSYITGIDVVKDEAQALSYAKILADKHNNALMAYVLASAYFKGDALPKDELLGEKYLEQAALANNSQAILLRAHRLQLQGKIELALISYQQAASMGVIEALIQQGLILMNAEGKLQDIEKGLSCLEEAANRYNSPKAQLFLAQYCKKIGQSDDANRWYILASNQGVHEAMAERGLLHIIPGSGVKWDPALTYRWWLSGENAGNETCETYRNYFLFIFIPLLLCICFLGPILVLKYLGKRLKRRMAAKAEIAKADALKSEISKD